MWVGCLPEANTYEGTCTVGLFDGWGVEIVLCEEVQKGPSAEPAEKQIQLSGFIQPICLCWCLWGWRSISVILLYIWCSAGDWSQPLRNSSIFPGLKIFHWGGRPVTLWSRVMSSHEDTEHVSVWCECSPAGPHWLPHFTSSKTWWQHWHYGSATVIVLKENKLPQIAYFIHCCCSPFLLSVLCWKSQIKLKNPPSLIQRHGRARGFGH